VDFVAENPVLLVDLVMLVDLVLDGELKPVLTVGL
jgi:hypothetical protein